LVLATQEPRNVTGHVTSVATMTTLLLIRHGETDWNASGRLQGHTDRPLNNYGRRQAAALAAALEDDGIAALYSSDLARARETAEILGARLGLPVALEPGLRERDWGSWEGLTPAERDAVEFVGEHAAAHRDRIVRTVTRIGEGHPGARVAVVTHGGSIRRVQAVVDGFAQPVIANCQIWVCRYEDGALGPSG
jgi:2,3-bisphosphoglycerate-dependent phosphoglycerate mutase